MRRASSRAQRGQRKPSAGSAVDAGPRHARRIAALLVLALTVSALALRLPGIGFMLPHLPHVDERVYLTQVETLRGEPSTAFEWRNFRYYPHLVARLAALVPAPEPAAETGPPATLAASLERATEPLRRIRLFVALLSIAIVPGTYLLARRFLERPPALLAAALAATSVLGLWYAQQARPHALAAVAALAAVLAALRLRRRGDFGSYVFGGAAAGIAMATLQSLVFVVPALVAAHVVRARTATRRPRLAFAAALALALAIGLLFYPFAFEQKGAEAPAPQAFEINLYGHGIALSDFNGRGFARLFAPWRDYDPILAGAVLLGAVLVVRNALRAARLRREGERVGARSRMIGARATAPSETPVGTGARGEALEEVGATRSESDGHRSLERSAWSRLMTRLRSRGDLFVVAAFVVPYVLVLGVYQRTFQRFHLPLLAFVACFAAWGVFAVLDRGARVRRSKFAVALALAVLALQTLLSVHVAELRTRPDTATVAARWIESHLTPEAGGIALLPPLDLPLFRTTDADDVHYRRSGGRIDLWPHWQKTERREPAPESTDTVWPITTMPMHAEAEVALLRDDPAAYLASLDASYAVFEINEAGRRPMFTRLRAAARAHGQLVARISPWKDPAYVGDPILYYWDSDQSPERSIALRALAMDRLGPTVEIYALEGLAR